MSVRMKKCKKRNAKGPNYLKTANVSSKSETAEDSSKDGPLHVGDHCMVHRQDGWFHPAEVLDTRFNDTEDYFEYYVHYEEYDRRLDEWVQRDRIMNSRSDISETNSKQNDDNRNVDLLNQSDRKTTRSQKPRLDKINHVPMSHEEMDPTTAALEKERKAITKIKYINKVQFGNYEIDTWYYSPFPDEYEKESKILICEYCLKYCKLETSFRYHMSQCKWKKPPGVKVYHKDSLSIWEVDSSQHKLYCQNLCLMAKLFLDHKTICFDVEPFLFYILWSVDEAGGHFIGYFSKEKESPECNNVACLLTMPQFQKRGYGKLLIAFSYELSKLEGLVASPEKPLSDFGELSYRSYWSWVLLDIFKNKYQSFSIEELSAMTSIAETDIIATLQSMDMMKYWKGEHVICVTPKIIEKLLSSEHYKPPRFTLEKSDIKWTPKKYDPLPGPSSRS
ncbi:histone acetyltransferase KAT8-like [Acyrthosiphon pisum]|uniref:Histone acetyltransferase n=1 Tax=Acyrthosiphon pisum TaxID=7029 RepID=A0A8R2ACU4_ACYPI|nr:histone acetyltransferase KAT8-like [Acyrthosiphon pisum]|eukprot:XP_003241077.1 PREDICTED: histone acetyltransferase KAT8-like [Acyrthosiphon pisum]